MPCHSASNESTCIHRTRWTHTQCDSRWNSYNNNNNMKYQISPKEWNYNNKLWILVSYRNKLVFFCTHFRPWSTFSVQLSIRIFNQHKFNEQNKRANHGSGCIAIFILIRSETETWKINFECFVLNIPLDFHWFLSQIEYQNRELNSIKNWKLSIITFSWRVCVRHLSECDFQWKSRWVCRMWNAIFHKRQLIHISIRLSSSYFQLHLNFFFGE